jgi:hypothetical protein
MRTTRRAVLRGLGGIAVGLPALEIFQPRRAIAGSAPQRYVVAFAGMSLGMDGGEKVVPLAEGPLAGQLTRGLAPIGDLELESRTSIVSGLTIPWGADGQIPPGGRAIGFHSHTPCPLLSGTATASEDDESLTGPTSDWVVAQAIGGPTLATRPVLSYRVQVAYYRGSNDTDSARGTMSARMNGSSLEQVRPQFSPKLAFEDMFAGFIPPDPAEAAAARFLLERRKSVLDLVRGDTEALLPRLGAVDRIRLQRHFDEIRVLENKLQQVVLPSGAECQMLGDPGEDPAMGGAVENGDTDGYASGGAYSGEEERAQLMVDLIHMAFVCDLSRVSSLMFTFAQCFLNANPLAGYPSDIHELSHYSVGGGEDGQNAMADAVAWHVGHVGRLARRLADSPDIDGGNILDNTALVLVFEGGVGFDPEGGDQGAAHSSENMAVVVMGGAGGLNAGGGGHIRAEGRHPVEVINTVMAAVGGPDQLGDVPGTIAGLVG